MGDHNSNKNNTNPAGLNSNPTTTTCITPLPRSLYPNPFTPSPSDFTRLDESPDDVFYRQPRFVQHIDDLAIAALKGYYGEAMKPGMQVLDLCSSWTSHVPERLWAMLGGCVGVGLNGEEMARNGMLKGWVVRDLNVVEEKGEEEKGPLREIQSGTLDVAICNVSIDYLTQPVAVLQEVRRCLKVGGTAHMAFSNRCFPTKVIGRWLRMGDAERRTWVGGYFWAAGGFEEVEEVVVRDGGDGGDPLFVVRARKAIEAVREE